MIALVVIAASLASATVGQSPDAPASAHVVPAALPAAPARANAMPDMSKWDPEHPSAAWLQRMVRPCARSGNRVVC
ncbi:hypothetical protein [Sphingomonas nostoxanthinifaciens]|uniref:hypothetical protein n=1 Tax=Sphingomonas nostoxanthinifaciens TaxID=2872652 RepID=UPI001CC1D606|nr:hypothetical protein [Sphingomonas nostoxanthinifaciens]UAK25390.1 hypothetical protein K8P63_04205 [Sphingomonas nostoxanthinifaciens]